MNSFNSARRDLLRVGSLGMAGAALPALASAHRMTRRARCSILNVRHYGAAGDGKTLDTPAVNRAIAAAAAGAAARFSSRRSLSLFLHPSPELGPSLSRRGRNHPGRRLAQARRKHRRERRHVRRGRAQHRLDAYQDYGLTTGTTRSFGAKRFTTSPSPAGG